MDRIDVDWLQTPPLGPVFEMLGKAGYRAYLVGGAVRDLVMGLSVGDMDVATDARPEAVIELAEHAGLKAIPTGIEHGTVTVVCNGEPVEITTFRRDLDTDGRHAVVGFTDDMAEDARRRDFTMNALYLDPRGVIHDPVGGLPDARAGYVRFIEDAGKRIEEDYLRILRYFRFNALYGRTGIDREALAAIAEHLDGLDLLAKERVGAEMRKLLSATDPAPSVAAMAQAGVLTRILPGAEATTLPILVHWEQALGLAPDAVRRLAALGGENPTDALRLSKADAKALGVSRDAMVSTSGPGELGYLLGVKRAIDVVVLRAAFGTEPPEGWQDAMHTGANATFPIDASDLMPDYQGAALGDRLKTLEDEWIRSEFSATREELLKT